MYSQETVHPPTRIMDLLNPVGGPEPIHRLKAIPSEHRQANVLPGFATIERAADGPGPPEYTLPPVAHMSATRSTAGDTVSGPHSYEISSPRQSYDGQQQAQYNLRAAIWDSSKGASNASDHYGTARGTLPSSQARQSLAAFHPTNGNQAMHPHTSSLYEMKPSATPTLPPLNWAVPPSQSAAHALYGHGHSAGLGPDPHESSSQSVRQQTSLSPAPAMFGPYVQTPSRGQFPHYSPQTMGNTPPSTSSGGGNSLNDMGHLAEHSQFQSSDRASLRLAEKSTRPTMPRPAPVKQYLPQSYLVPIPPQDPFERKRSYASASAEEVVSPDSPKPTSSATVARLGGSFDDTPKPKKPRTKARVTGGSTGASEKNGKRANPPKKRNEQDVDMNASTNFSGSSSHSSAASKGKDKAIGRTFGHLQTSDGHAALPFGYIGFGVGIMPVGPHAAGTSFNMQAVQMPMFLAMAQGPHSKPVPMPELQYARCMSNRYKTDIFPRCVSCTRRWAGDTCRFQGIRILLRDENKNLLYVSFIDSTKADAAKMNLPERWNVELQERHVKRTMATVARALLPHLKKEQCHLKQASVVRRPRETDVRATCDTCMTSLFSSTWMCRQCGREACEQCFKTIRELTSDPNQHEVVERRERHSQANPFFLSCAKRTEHTIHTFHPVSRFLQKELDDSVSEMERLVNKNAVVSPKEVEADERDCKGNSAVGSEGSAGSSSAAVKREGRTEGGANQEQTQVAFGADARTDNGVGISAEENSNGTTVDPPADSNTNGSAKVSANPSSSSFNNAQPVLSASDTSKSPTSENYDDGVCTLVSEPVPPSLPSDSSSSSSLPPALATSSTIPTWAVPYYTGDSLTEDPFSILWAKGVPLVVTGLLGRFQIQWTPEYFKAKYGSQGCIILECQLDTNKRVTVGEFFEWFGKYEGRTECWKLKDWPPSTDFKTAFPELYEDFSRAVPVPSYTRRDGAMNISSHFPSNTIMPDLGPKMYNAFASKDEPGSKGSTRLHMDMADAVNIMLHAEKTPDGAPGSAAWDIFRAEDSPLIRQFLRKHFKGKFQNDPIHAQLFYLDVSLRRQLFDEFGVKSFRMYQKPGEAVFIPAGCAHQVINLADCVKVACDFVSPDNIERCERLTEEFRDQNQSMVWKEDVLQLRTMMWYAWLSCRKQLQQNKEKWGIVEEREETTNSGENMVTNETGEEKEDLHMEVDADASRLNTEEPFSPPPGPSTIIENHDPQPSQDTAEGKPLDEQRDAIAGDYSIDSKANGNEVDGKNSMEP